MKHKLDFGEFDFGVVFQNLVFEATFWLAAVLLFFKTSDLGAAFAPKQIMGFVGVESLYGLVFATIVEGCLISAKYSIKNSPNALSFMWNGLLIFATFLLSAGSQIVDGLVVREILLTQPPEVQLIVNYGVPLIPSVVLGLMLARNVLDALPPDVLSRMFSRQRPIRDESGLFGGRVSWRKVGQSAEDKPPKV